MMRVKRLLAQVLGVALLAGCQQASKDAPRAADENSDGLSSALAQAMAENASKGGEYTPTEAFKGKIEELGLRMAERLLTKCIHRAAGETMDACFHNHMLAAFDTNGAVAGHCPQRADLDADLKCIALGGIAYKLAPKVGGDAMKDFDWADPEKSTNDLSSQFVLQRIRECLADGAASDPKECVTKRITKGLELTGGDLEPCYVVIDDDYKFGQCIGEAFSYKFMSEGISRI